MAKKKSKYLFSICLSTRLQGEFLFNCLDSIENSQTFSYKGYNEQSYQTLILVDGKDSANPEYSERLKGYTEKYPHIKVFEHDKFDSLSAAWNFVIKKAKGEYVCILNDDTIVHDKWLDYLYQGWNQILSDKSLQGKNIKPGIIAPTISQAFLKISVREKPSGDGGKLIHLPRLKEYPAGVCYFTTKKILQQMDYFDESYKDFSAEDADFCYKIWDAGYDIFVDERVWLKHIHNATTGNHDQSKRKLVYERNGKQFTEKWAKYFKDQTIPSPSKIKKHIKDDELVSIVCPVLNGDKFIHIAIESVQKQSYKNLEILVFDAGSSDKTINIVSKIAENDKRVRLIRDQSMPYSQAFRKAFDMAKGDYIGSIRADDWMHETCVEKCVSKLRKEKKSSMIYTNQVECDDKLKPVGKTKRTSTMYSPLMMICNFMVCDFRLFKTKYYKEITKDWKQIGDWMPEYDLILRFSELKEQEVLFINEFLYHKRFLPNGMHAKYCLEQLLDMKHCAEAALDRRGLKTDGYYLTHEATLKSNLHKGGSITASCKKNRNLPEVWDKINQLCHEDKREMYKRADGRDSLEEIKNIIKNIENKKVLDIGCGNGEVLKLLKEHGIKPENIYGIDFSPEAIKNSKKNNPDVPEGNILLKNVYEKVWWDNKFDVILCTMVFEHMQKPQQAMRYIKNNLNVGGKLYTAVPSETDNRYDVEGLNINFWRNKDEYEQWLQTFGLEYVNVSEEYGIAGSLIHELTYLKEISFDYKYLEECKNKADITIFMPMHNREEYVKQAIRCLQHQTYENWLLKVYDDFSEDNGCAVVEELIKEDPRIELIKMEKKTGITPLYPIMYSTSKTEYFCQVDSDDYIAPSTLQITRDYLEENKKVGVAFTDYISMDADEKLQAIGDRTRMRFDKDSILEYFMTFQFRLQRTKVFQDMDKTDYPARITDENGNISYATRGPDYELSVRMSEVAMFDRVPFPCYYYRQHKKTINSTDKDGQRRSSWIIIQCARKRRAKKYNAE